MFEHNLFKISVFIFTPLKGRNSNFRRSSHSKLCSGEINTLWIIYWWYILSDNHGQWKPVWMAQISYGFLDICNNKGRNFKTGPSIFFKFCLDMLHSYRKQLVSTDNGAYWKKRSSKIHFGKKTTRINLNIFGREMSGLLHYWAWNCTSMHEIAFWWSQNYRRS